jgi:hypothetical protein
MKIFSSLFGGGGAPKQPKAQVSQGTAPAAAPGAAAAPANSPEEIKKQQTAYYQNMLAGLGQGTETGELPQGIQENINRQAGLISGS